MNSIIVSGRLVRDWVTISKKTKDQDFYTNSIAVQRDYKENGEYNCDFFDISAFSNVGQYLSTYSKKGDTVILQGIACINSYVDKDGIGRKAFHIKVVKANVLAEKQDPKDVIGDNDTDFIETNDPEDIIPF